MRYLLALLLLALGAPLAAPTAVGQSANAHGWPVVRTIAPQQYRGTPRVATLAHGRTGQVYLGLAAQGIRRYDGTAWTIPPGSGRWHVRSIAFRNGHPYVATKSGLFRRSAPSDDGALWQRVPLANTATTDSLAVRRVVHSAEGLWVHADDRVYRVTGDNVQAIELKGAVGTLVHGAGGVYAQRTDGFLVRLDGSAPRLLPVALPPYTGALQAVLPWKDAQRLIVAERRIYRFDGTSIARWRTAIDGVLLNATVHDAVRLPNEDIALATATRGLYILTPQGQLRFHLSTAAGLPSNRIPDVMVGPGGALWAATGAGVVRVAWPDPVTLFDARDGLEASLRDVAFHDGRLYVATARALLQKSGDGFRAIARLGAIHALLPTRYGLFVAAQEGLWQWTDGRLSQIAPISGRALRVDRTQDVVYVTGAEGAVWMVERRGRRWTARRLPTRTPQPGTSIAQDASGTLWIGYGGGIQRIDDPLQPARRVATVYDTTDGLPTAARNRTLQIGSRVWVSTSAGLYRFARPQQRFEPLSTDIPTGHPVTAVAAQSPDRVWLGFGLQAVGRAQRTPAGGYNWLAGPFQRVIDVGAVQAITTQADSVVWFATGQTLVRYAVRQLYRTQHSFATVIRGTATVRDSSVAVEAAVQDSAAGLDPSAFPVRVLIGAMTYAQYQGQPPAGHAAVQYRYRLDRADAWSAWQTTPYVSLGRMAPGAHRMEVQARNLYGVEGAPATLYVHVLPPWYRTWWAYGAYCIVLAVALYGAGRWRAQRTRARQKALEEQVAQRTAKIRRQKQQIEQQAHELKTLDAAKSRFFANVSHEFRTPLTLILGPARALRTWMTEHPEAPLHQVERIERNAHRLLRLVQQLLDLARLDAGTMTIQAQPTDMAAAVARITQVFAPLAEQQGITLEQTTERSVEGLVPTTYADPELLEQIVSNLISNAIKFTPSGGRVTVHVHEQTTGTAIIVRDTGVGIPADEQAHIFDRFARVAHDHPRSQEGTGIGLALVKQLVEHHGGTITVDSTTDEGSTFRVWMPRGRDHLSDEQVVDSLDRPNALTSLETADTAAHAFKALYMHAGNGTSSADAATTAHRSAADDAPVVLVVDDNADVRGYVRSILAEDFRLVEAADGREGLNKAREHLPDVILADVMMPVMDGLALTKALKGDPHTAALPVILLTARAEAHDEVHGLDAGADDYITKPFHAEVLEARVRGVLSLRKRLRRQLEREQGAAAERSAPPPPPDTLGDGDTAPMPAYAGEAQALYEQSRAAVHDHLTDPTFGVDALAEALAMSRSTLYRRFNEHNLPSPGDLIRNTRMEHAARLLCDEEGSVTEVAYAMGYNSLSTFSSAFQEYYACSPTAYVEQHTATSDGSTAH
ncbi:ATP-binding protein [Salisaeta longa]|uniref:ATP-binding protein n=1 Tax=Salisaeta longa TaxID=503170 RepID=UPI0003B6E85C|nr:ATP-binding protein [Salisaeta longa]